MQLKIWTSLESSEMTSRFVWIFRFPVAFEDVSQLLTELVPGPIFNSRLVLRRTKDDTDSAGAQEIIGGPVRRTCNISDRMGQVPFHFNSTKDQCWLFEGLFVKTFGKKFWTYVSHFLRHHVLVVVDPGVRDCGLVRCKCGNLKKKVRKAHMLTK